MKWLRPQLDTEDLNQPTYRLCMVLIVVLSVTLGIYRISSRPLWFDEAVSWAISDSDFAGVVKWTAMGEDCGGFLYGSCLYVWTQFAGRSEVALRLPSVMISAGLVCAVSAIGRLTWNRRASVYIGLICASHPLVVAWSREARAYILLIFAASLCILGMQLFERGRSRALLATACCMAVASHVFGVFVVACVSVYLLARVAISSERSIRQMLKNILPLLPSYALLAAWTFLLRFRIQRNLNDFHIRTPLDEASVEALGAILPPLWLLAPLLMLTVLLAFFRNKEIGQRLTCLMLVIFAGVVAGPFAASILSRGDHHFVASRYFVAAVPVMVIFLGYLCSQLRTSLAVLLAAGLVSFWTFESTVTNDIARNGQDGDMRSVAQCLSEQATDATVYLYPELQHLALRYYGLSDRVHVMPLSPEMQNQMLREASWSGVDMENWFVFLNRKKVDQAIKSAPLESFEVLHFTGVTILKPRANR